MGVGVGVGGSGLGPAQATAMTAPSTVRPPSTSCEASESGPGMSPRVEEVLKVRHCDMNSRMVVFATSPSLRRLD